MPGADAVTPGAARSIAIATGGLILVLLALRLLYHATYLTHDPFARSTFSDGQIYEEAARDLLAAPPLGTRAFFLQGSYAYLLAAGLALRGMLSDALILQLALAALAGLAFYAAARSCLGRPAALLSSVAWLSSGALAFYENKYVSAAMGCSCNVFVIWAFSRLSDPARRRPGWAAFGLGLASALSVLARPNLLVALPFSLAAMLALARAQRRPFVPLLAASVLGLSLGLTPMLARNWLVTGRASVFPSHGGGIPFYIGNNPSATGLWNTAGGLLSGQVLLERQELASQLRLDPGDARVDDRIGDALYARAFAFIRAEPRAWLDIQLRKLFLMTGNDELVHDFDQLGERELLAPVHPVDVPFGFFLGVGALGLLVLARSDASARALLVLLLGQLTAVFAANLFWFTSAQNRLPLVVPLAFASGPALLALLTYSLQRARHVRPSVGTLATLALCALLIAQAFVPRSRARQPSAAHYYNLANVEESLGLTTQALQHYARATERNPRQPVFWLRLAHLARRADRPDVASYALSRLDALPDVPSEIRSAAAYER